MVRVVKKASERRKEIINVARDLFQANDFKQVTIQELMKKTNITKGGIYHHFSSKTEILDAVVEDMTDESFRKGQNLLKENINLHPIVKLKILITESNNIFHEGKLLDNLHRPENYVIHAKHLARMISKMSPLFASVIKEGCEKKIFKTKNPLEITEFFVAAMQFTTDLGFYPWSEDQLKRRMKAIPSILESLLGSDKGAFGDLKIKRKHNN